MDLTRKGPGYLAVLISAATWATPGIFIRFILDSTDVSTLVLAFWRDLLSLLVLFLILLASRPALLRIDKKHLKWFAALGCLSLGVFHVLWNLGVTINGVAVSTVQQAVMPIIVAVFATLIWGEACSLRKGMAIGFTLLGAVLISGLIKTGVAGILCMMEIPFAALYSFLFLGERLALIQCIGAVAVVVGVVLLNLGKDRATKFHT
jgi:drug/metabolite transporter (DMT)-like permease